MGSKDMDGYARMVCTGQENKIVGLLVYTCMACEWT